MSSTPQRRATPPRPGEPTEWEREIAQIAGASAVRSVSAEMNSVISRAMTLMSRSVADPTKDVGTAEVPYSPRYLVPPVAWPVVSALGALAPGFVVLDRDPATEARDGALYLPEPMAVVEAGQQSQEKAEVKKAPITAALRTLADLTTYGEWCDLALQADYARDAVTQALRAGVARKVEADVVSALTTAAGAAATDLKTAVQTVAAAHGPNVVLITGLGTADLMASGLPVVVSPGVTGTLVVAADGVSGLVAGPFDLSAPVPSLLGHDMSAWAVAFPVKAATGAVARVA